MFGVLIKMAFPDKEDELGPGIDFDLITLLLSPAGAALGNHPQKQYHTLSYSNSPILPKYPLTQFIHFDI